MWERGKERTQYNGLPKNDHLSMDVQTTHTYSRVRPSIAVLVLSIVGLELRMKSCVKIERIKLLIGRAKKSEKEREKSL